MKYPIVPFELSIIAQEKTLMEIGFSYNEINGKEEVCYYEVFNIMFLLNIFIWIMNKFKSNNINYHNQFITKKNIKKTNGLDCDKSDLHIALYQEIKKFEEEQIRKSSNIKR